jgi:hypothetical protein
LDRIVCHMEWAANNQSHIHDLVEFESRVNEVWRRHDDAVEQNQTKATACAWLRKMQGAVWIPKLSTGCLSHSTRPRVTVWESDCPSVAR